MDMKRGIEPIQTMRDVESCQIPPSALATACSQDTSRFRRFLFLLNTPIDTLTESGARP
jgi:hypothetical protein